MHVTKLAALGAALLALAASACDGSGACGDSALVSDDPNAPRVLDAALPKQLEQDSWTLILTVDFEDANADLAEGSVVFYLGKQSDSATSQPLLPAFKQSTLEESATSGTLTVPLRFDDDISNGTKVDLGLQLVDSASLRSNCYGLALEFEVNRR